MKIRGFIIDVFVFLVIAFCFGALASGLLGLVYVWGHGPPRDDAALLDRIGVSAAIGVVIFLINIERKEAKWRTDVAMGLGTFIWMAAIQFFSYG